MNQETLIVYHRCGGKSLGYPPNTLLTAQWAMSSGAKAIEYDVAIAKDGDKFRVFAIEPKLLNDAGLDINNLAWSDVQRINAGNEKFGTLQVTQLEEMLAGIDSDKVAHQIQIKGQHPASVREVLTRVKGVKNFIITAFDKDVIREIKTIDSNVRVGWLVKPAQEGGDEAGVDLTAKLVTEANTITPYSDEEIADILTVAHTHQVDVAMLCGPRIKDQLLLDRFRQEGFEIGAWGAATNLSLARQLIKLGIDRFTLDNPEELIG